MNVLSVGKWLFSAGKWVGGFFTGGNLDSLLRTIDNNLDNDTEKEKVKAEVTKVWIDRQASLLSGRTWWFQLFFVIPLGLYWACVMWVSSFPQWGWTVADLPPFFKEVSLIIIGALFVTDASKAIASRFKGA